VSGFSGKRKLGFHSSARLSHVCNGACIGRRVIRTSRFTVRGRRGHHSSNDPTCPFSRPHVLALNLPDDQLPRLRRRVKDRGKGVGVPGPRTLATFRQDGPPVTSSGFVLAGVARRCATFAGRIGAVGSVLVQGQVEELVTGFLHLSSASDGRRARAAWLSGPRATTASGIDEQTEYRIRYRVEGSEDGGQSSERVSLLLVTELQFQDHAPPGRMPCPAPCTVGDRRLDQQLAVSAPPSIGGDVPVLNFDGQPEGHA